MHYTVEVTLHLRKPLTQEAMFAVAELDGVAVGLPGGRHLETTLTVDAEDWLAAANEAIRLVGERVAGKVIGVDVMTTAEADRRSKAQPRMVGIAEVAEMLEVSKQRAYTIAKRKDFPDPAAKLASGPVWRWGEVSDFIERWGRKPGRPAKAPERSAP